MPLFVIEREFAEVFDPDGESIQLVDVYNAEHDLKWITSFLSADKKKTYCSTRATTSKRFVDTPPTSGCRLT